MPIIERASGTLDLFEDIGSFRRPDEGLGVLIVFVDVLSDSHDQFFWIVKDPATQSILRKVSEEAFHHVQPRAAGRREVDVKPGMTSEPSLHLRMFVRGIVVDDQMDLKIGRNALVDMAQKGQELLMPMGCTTRF